MNFLKTLKYQLYSVSQQLFLKIDFRKKYQSSMRRRALIEPMFLFTEQESIYVE